MFPGNLATAAEYNIRFVTTDQFSTHSTNPFV